VFALFDHASELPYTFQHCHATVLQLSGGQKARVALARAAYAGAHVCLLDDPLSAVDPRVSRILFNQCIGKEGIMRVSAAHCGLMIKMSTRLSGIVTAERERAAGVLPIHGDYAIR
jgi:ABC-type lipoprotein export system ATPase subunit